MNPLDNTELPPVRYIVNVGHVIAELKTEEEHRVVVETPIFDVLWGLSSVTPQQWDAILGCALDLMGPRHGYAIFCPAWVSPSVRRALQHMASLLEFEINWDMPRNEIIISAGQYKTFVEGDPMRPPMCVRFRGCLSAAPLDHHDGGNEQPAAKKPRPAAPAPAAQVRGFGASEPILPGDPPVSDKL